MEGLIVIIRVTFIITAAVTGIRLVGGGNKLFKGVTPLNNSRHKKRASRLLL